MKDYGENKLYSIEGRFISYDGGHAYLLSNDECKFWVWQNKEESQEVCDKLNEIIEENERLKKEIQEVKTDEKQLSISFMGYKMQLIEVLQRNYNYAYKGRKNHLDDTMVAKAYGLTVIYYGDE